MAIYDAGTASLAADGTVTGVGTTWMAPLTLIRVGATIVFKTEPVKIYTISEIISDTQINVYNPNSETIPAGTGYTILAHDGITVQGLAQDVAETLRYYQSRETEVSTAVDIFKDFDQDKFSNDVNQVNTQYGQIVTIGAQVSSDAEQVTADKNAAAASALESASSAVQAEASAVRAENAAGQFDGSIYLKKDDNLASVGNANTARANINAASLGFNSFAGNQTIIQEYPQLRLESTAVGNDFVGKTFAIENTIGSHASMIFSNNEISPELRIATILKPSNTRPVYIPFNGGLSNDGNSVPNAYLGDFNNLQQGWSTPNGAVFNAPYSGGVYGSCFTQCTQGTQHGPSAGKEGLLYQQRFYSSGNEIYIRTQVNTGAWSPWLQVTTSAVSDERLKDIYGDLDLSESLDNICKMEFKNFKFKDDEKQRQRRGVISQQIMNIDREYVWEVGGYYHLDQTPMLLDGLAAIKALKIKSDESDKEMVALKAEIAELKEMIKQLMQ